MAPTVATPTVEVAPTVGPQTRIIHRAIRLLTRHPSSVSFIPFVSDRFHFVTSGSLSLSTSVL